MNSKLKFAFISTLLLISSVAFAQRQQASIKFITETEWPFCGDYVYSYITQTNGSEVLDGPFSMKATESQKGLTYKYYYTASIYGTYTLTGAHKSGNLHGPMKLTANLNVSATNGDKQTNSYSFSGAFVDGVPNGNFIVTYKEGYPEKVNVTYNNGILVGPYTFDGTDSDGFKFKVTGQLTPAGKLTGKWVIGSDNYEFLNGVMLRGHSGELDAKARQFASGAITEEDLRKDYIYVGTGSVPLGAWVNGTILNEDVIYYDKLGGYDFSASYEVGFQLLYQLSFLNDEGFELLKADWQAYLNGDTEALNIHNIYDGGLEQYNKKLAYSESKGLYYIYMYERCKYGQYCTGYPEWDAYRNCNIFLTTEQSDIIKAMVEKAEEIAKQKEAEKAQQQQEQQQEQLMQQGNGYWW